MAYLLDTCIWIQHLKNPGGRLESRIEMQAPSDILTCSVVKGELWAGAYRYERMEDRFRILRSLLRPFVSLSFDDLASWEYASLRYDLESAGNIIGPNDLKIAAIALHHKLILVTTNTREFRRVPGLVVEDWTQ